MCMSFYFRVSLLAFSYILSNRLIVHCFYNMSQRLFACVFSACNIRRPDVLFLDLSCGKKENEKTCECRSTIRRLENRRAPKKQYPRSSMFRSQSGQLKSSLNEYLLNSDDFFLFFFFLIIFHLIDNHDELWELALEHYLSVETRITMYHL